MTEKQPSAEAIALVMRIKGIYRHGHEHDEADALALDAFAARSRWRPIGNEPTSQYLLTFSENDDVGLMRKTASGDWWRKSIRDALHPSDHPTSWQPLPKPPSENGD